MRNVTPRRRKPFSIPKALGGFAVGVWVLFFMMASAAQAETQIEVTTPADGFTHPGQPVPLLVEARADGAVSGTLLVWFQDGSGSSSSQEIELPGGSTKEFLVLMFPPEWGGLSGQATFTPDDKFDEEPTTERFSLRAPRNAELVAISSSLAAREFPEKVEIAMELGDARIFELDPRLLGLGTDGLALFDQILFTKGDFEALTPADMEVIQRWVLSAGGTLIVDSPAGTSLPLEGFVPQNGYTRVEYGLGEIRFSNGKAQAGDYDGLFMPSIPRSPNDMPFGGGGHFGDTSLLARDAGFTPPSIRTVVLMLLAYSVIAGPVVWLILRRSNREPLIWATIPVAALLAVAGVWAGGRTIRNNTTTGHTSLHIDLPGSRISSTQVLVSAPGGGHRGLGLKPGWEMVSSPTGQLWLGDEAEMGFEFEEMAGPIFDGPAMPGRNGRNANGNTPFVDGDRLVIDLPPGGIGMVQASQTATNTNPSWAVDLVPTDDGYEGTITNLTPYDLTNIMVASGRGFSQLKELLAGESASIHLKGTNQPALWDDRLYQGLYRDMEREIWGGPNGRGGGNLGSINPTLMLNWLSRNPRLSTPGFVIVAGWTRQAPAPLDELNGGIIESGRTGFVAAQRLADIDQTDESVMRILRGMSTRVEDISGHSQCNEGALTIQYTVPRSATWANPVLEVRSRMTPGIDIWSGHEWLPIGMNDLPATTKQFVLDIPDGALVDGQLHIKAAMSCDVWGNNDPFPTLRNATAGEQTHRAGDLGQVDANDEPSADPANPGTTPPPPPPQSSTIVPTTTVTTNA